MNYFYQHWYPHPFLIPTHNPSLVRGSWTPFTWVEKYNYLFNGPFNRAEVALTFDDGPDPYFTPAILDKLAKYGVKATFFLLGENAEKWPDMARRIVAEGHIIGNHTYAHPKSTNLSLNDFKADFERAECVIEQLAHYKPKFFRPPYGAIDEEQLNWLTQQGVITIQWSVDTNDWQGLSGEEIAKIVVTDVYPGSIVLQHNADGVPLQGTVEALDLFIPQLQSKGVRFVTLPEMFRITKERS